MSPASQGALEVERYIGSCLISSTVRPSMHKDPKSSKKLGYSAKGYAAEQCQGQYATGWAGTPLISMTSSPRRNSQQRSSPSPPQNQQLSQPKQPGNEPEQQLAPGQLHNKSPLVRLAIHTQGAPLILTGRFHRGKGMNPNSNSNNLARCAASRNGYDPSQRKLQNPVQVGPKEPANATNIDSLSVASDESSNNSENSLPRIIKPRKRRKKDRKPTLGAELNKQNCPEEAALAVEPKPAHACYDSGHYRGQRRPGQLPKDNSYGRLHTCPTTSQEVVDTRQQRYAYRHVQVKVLDDNRNVIVPLPVRQLKGYRANSNSNATQRYEGNVDECYGSCQCRYCEPSALIWDVDPGYSAQYQPAYPSQLPVFLSPYARHDQFFDESHHPGVCLHRDGSVAVLRRSWSDPASYFSDEIPAPQRDVGVIGDRGQSELRTSATGGAWRPDVSSPSSTSSSLLSASTGSQGLEVSTEIVTSPNGHRDLEIKFYSSSPSSSAPVGLGYAEEDAEEEFSDIWSYHESKLQQDFRTLLQAEE